MSVKVTSRRTNCGFLHFLSHRDLKGCEFETPVSIWGCLIFFDFFSPFYILHHLSPLRNACILAISSFLGFRLLGILISRLTTTMHLQLFLIVSLSLRKECDNIYLSIFLYLK